MGDNTCFCGGPEWNIDAQKHEVRTCLLMTSWSLRTVTDQHHWTFPIVYYNFPLFFIPYDPDSGPEAHLEL